jgi:hypothetical protein
MIVRKIGTRGAFLGRIRMQRRTSVTRPLAVFFLLFAVFLTPALASRDGSTDRPGLDYRTFELSAPNPDLCESACKREAQCRSWTYSWPGAKGPKAMCALKTGVPPKRSDTCCISGVMATSSPVTRTDDPKPQPPAPQPSAPSTTAKADPKPAPPPLPVPAPAPRAEEPEDRTAVVPKPKPPATQQAQQEDTADAADTLPPAKVAACRDYANRALAQNAENRSLGCGLSGSRWGFGYDAYFNYCAGNPDSEWQSARSARDRELELCKTRLANRQQDDRPTIELPDVDVDLGDLFNRGVRDERFCRTFAAQSIRQVEEARRLDCGFGGTRWSPSRVRQARLCEDIGPRAAAQLLNARSAQLDRCRAAAGGCGFAGDVNGCAGYAQESVRQARIARQLGCGYGGARWTTSYRAHLRWCQTAPRREVMAELRIRERFLDRCE